jgi:hypothetical protein
MTTRNDIDASGRFSADAEAIARLRRDLPPLQIRFQIESNWRHEDDNIDASPLVRNE